MKRLLLPSILPALLLAVACAPVDDPGNDPDGGSDAGTKRQKVIVSMNGTVSLHPTELEWRARKANEGAPLATPALEGASLDIEDAIKASLKLAPLKSSTVGAGGAWSVADVDVSDVTLAVVATVRGEGLMQSGYGLVRGKPTQNLVDKPVYVVSLDFVAQLAAAVGREAEDLENEGFIFGRIVDREGNGVAGARLALYPGMTVVEKEGLLYLNEDYTGTVDPSGGTSSSGAFVFLDAGSAKDYVALKSGMQFIEKLSGSRSGAVVSMFVEEKVE